MFTIHDGEIIFKEKYGSLARQRLYVKPQDQLNVVILDEEKRSDFTNLLTRIFLPQGYPDSVSRDYTNYQIWDTAQAFCSTITGILATQEVLRGVGVGDTTATPLAATVTWVLKDGCGHLGKIFFAFSRGTHLDAYSKKWRLYADTLNDAAMCIEIALPAFKNYTTLMLCMSTLMKAIVGVAGGATRAAMTQHHAIRGNLADVSAKDSAQETAVNLIASMAALLIIALFGNSLTIFVTMMVFHIIFNYFAVRSVCLRTLNEPRLLLIIERYLKHEVISKPCYVNRNEPIVFRHLGPIYLDESLCGFRIKVGHSIKTSAKKHSNANYMKNVQYVYKYNAYIIFANIHARNIYIHLKDTATTDDILRSYFHAVLYGIVICAINDYYLPIYKSPENTTKPFPQICATLQTAEWSKDTIEMPSSEFNFEPSIELMSFLNRTVEKEWYRLRKGLEQIGWDLKKHLIVTDEWRICTSKLVTKETPADERIIPEVLATAASKMMTFIDNNDDIVEKAINEIKTYTIEPEGKATEESSDMNAYLGISNNETRPGSSHATKLQNTQSQKE